MDGLKEIPGLVRQPHLRQGIELVSRTVVLQCSVATGTETEIEGWRSARIVQRDRGRETEEPINGTIEGKGDRRR